MDKQEQLKDLLKQFSQEEIREALGNEKKNKNRRRGKGKRKNKNPRPEFVNKFDEMMQDISLTSDEKKELKQAEEADAADASASNKADPFRGRRNKVSKVDIHCRSCHREYKMYPSQIHNRERWTCNRCLSGRQG